MNIKLGQTKQRNKISKKNWMEILDMKKYNIKI